jgi:hypothetical protein
VVEEALAAAAATTMFGCPVHAYQGRLLSWRHERLLHASVLGRPNRCTRPHGGRYWVLEWDVPAGTFMSAVTDEADDSLFLLQAGRRRERPWGGPPSRGRSPFGGHLGGQRPPRSPVAAAHRHRWAGLSGALGRRRSSRSGRAGVPADPRRPGPRPSGSASPPARRSTARSIVWKWRVAMGHCARGAPPPSGLPPARISAARFPQGRP